MARKLKTYTTSAGFFDLAIAAPSMKAALEAWGATSNLFHQGFAAPTDDPRIVAATMARPGVILRRPVGSNGAFTEHAELPKLQDIGRGTRAPPKRRAKPVAPAPSQPADEKAARAASAAFERERKRRERQARREEAAQAKERERRDRAVAAAEAALDDGRRAHEASIGKMDRERAALDRKRDAEEARWKKQEEQLERALRRARSPGHLRLV